MQGWRQTHLVCVALVVVTIAVQPVAMRTERGAVFIEAAPQTGERILIPRVMAQLDGAQGFEVLVDEGQDLRHSLRPHPPALRRWRDRGNAAAAVGNREWSADGHCGWPVRKDPQRPEGEQAVIDDIEGLGFVTEMMLATRFGGAAVLLRGHGAARVGWNRRNRHRRPADRGRSPGGSGPDSPGCRNHSPACRPLWRHTAAGKGVRSSWRADSGSACGNGPG